MACAHVRLRHRLVAHLAGAGLDNSLAAGRPPDTSPRLEARADALLAPRARRALAGNWARLADRALERGPAVVDARTPVAAGSILAASEEIGRLIAVLAADRSPEVRLVVLARRLLVDGGSPVYDNGAGPPLRQVLAEALSPGGPPSLPARTTRYRARQN